MDLEKKLLLDSKKFNETWLNYWNFIDDNNIEISKMNSTKQNTIKVKNTQNSTKLNTQTKNKSPAKSTVKKVTNPKNNRPTFYLDDEKIQELRAGGVLFYRFNPDIADFELLMIYARNNYEDFGGCTDAIDKNIMDTVTREVVEESNEIFKKEFIKEHIEKAEPIYIKHCKYALYFIELDDYIDPTDFGDKEIHDDIDRTVEWIPYKQFNDQQFIEKLNFRLKSFNVLNHLKNILIRI